MGLVKKAEASGPDRLVTNVTGEVRRYSASSGKVLAYVEREDADGG